MRFSIASKITAVTITGAIIAAIVAMGMTVVLMRKTSDAQLDAAVWRLQHVVDEYYRIEERAFTGETRHAAANKALIEAVSAGNSESLRTLGAELMKEGNADLCTITDAEGIVLARGHSDRKGDSLAKQYMVRKALQGEVTAGIVASTVIPFSIRAGAPIEKDGQIIGTISLGVSIVTEEFVDRLKRLTDLDVALFLGDTLVVTTNLTDGKRSVGNKLADPDIKEAVLTRGELLLQDVSILGAPYKTAYWPVTSLDNKIIGTWFLGQPIQDYIDKQRQTLLFGVAGLALIAACLACVSVIFGKRLARPIKEVTAFSQAISRGELDTPLQVRATDEVGVLAGALGSMVENLKARIAESERKTREAAEHEEKALAAMQESASAGEKAERSRQAVLAAAVRVNEVVNSLSSATDELSVQVEQSRKGAEAQRQAVASAASLTEEMNATVRDVARNAAVASDGSEGAREKALEGAGVVSKSIEALGRVQSSTESMARESGELGKQAEAIGAIMSVINDIPTRPICWL